jgi:hypothetical protein
MMRKSAVQFCRLALAIAALLITATISSQAGTFTAFGPQNYQRGAGAPVTVTTNFSVQNPNLTYTLKVFNGGLQDNETELVSSGFVTINGVQVIGPSNFNQNVAEVDVPVTLQASNTIGVQVRGKPGGLLTVEIIGVDNNSLTITATASPAANAAGWNNTNVTVMFACSDSTSTVTSCPAPQTVTTEGANQVISGTATDAAGNSATASVILKIDKTPPAISAAVSPVPNAAGWNNSNVTVSFTCSDSLSGVVNCPSPIAVTTEGANQAFSGSVTDVAGNSASTSVTVRLDKTPPAISAAVSPAPNAAGWNNSDVTVSFTCSDALSGVVNCPSPITVATEGANQAISGSVTDVAGNSASASVTVQLDKTPPTIAPPCRRPRMRQAGTTPMSR